MQETFASFQGTRGCPACEKRHQSRNGAIMVTIMAVLFAPMTCCVSLVLFPLGLLGTGYDHSVKVCPDCGADYADPTTWGSNYRP